MLLGYVASIEALLMALDGLKDTVTNMLEPEEVDEEFFKLIKMSKSLLERKARNFKDMYDLDKNYKPSEEYSENLQKMLDSADKFVHYTTSIIGLDKNVLKPGMTWYHGKQFPIISAFFKSKLDRIMDR